VRDLLDERASSEQVRAAVETPAGFDAGLFTTVSELGLTGLLVPEERGGSGGEFADVAVVLHELGRRAVPLPFVQSAVLAPTALLAAGSPEADDLLAALAAGERRAAVVFGGPQGSVDRRTWTVGYADGTLRGRVGSVLDASSADELVVVADAADGPVVVLVAAADAEVVATPTTDRTRGLADVGLDGVGTDRVLARGREAEELAGTLVRTAAWATACDATGLAERITEETAAYARERQQFGRAIGSFQAIKHSCADMWIAVECARASLDPATLALAGPDAGVADSAVAIAKATATDAGVAVAERAVQNHGGIGFTWEHDAHIWLKRALLDRALYGSPTWWRRRLADAVLPAGVPA
jgi:alkylation response protein AidB-like acyl-CoA dehydrogenase